MSRSNPEILQNPSTRWFEWNGEKGTVIYYDKEQEVNIKEPLPFTFLVLDQLGTVKGWHNESESGIYANEVHRIDRQPLTVKSFDGGILAEGLYKNIKDTVKAKGGRYVSSVYIAYYRADELVIGNISLKGAALSAWMDFTKKIGKDLYEKAIVIDGYSEGQKGSITYRVPTFQTKQVKEETNHYAVELDKTLQEYLDKKSVDPEPVDEGLQSPPMISDEELYGDMDEEEANDLPF